MLDDPRAIDRVHCRSRATRPRPVGGWGGPCRSGVVWETCPCCGDLAALVWSSDGEMAEFDHQGGCALTDGQVGELPQRRRWEGSRDDDQGRFPGN